MKICFVGLGTMGMPMAKCLIQSGLSVSSWDISDSAGSDLSGRCKTLIDAAHGADVVVTMLPVGDHVTQIVEEILSFNPTGPLVFIDSSTIDVTTTQNLAGKVKDAGHGFVDAPVSGGVEGALAGSLSFMVGGEVRHVERVMPLLEIMGGKITHFGDAGAGQSAKACHNMICGITALGVCEAFALADSLGLDMQMFFDMCKGAAAQSWILENRCPVPGPAPNAPASNGYAPGFAAALMAKDLRLAQKAAEATGQETPFGSEAARRFTDYAQDRASGALDFSSIYRTIRNG